MLKQGFLFLILFLLSACVQLSPAGSQVQILADEQRALVSACKYLGTVSVSSKDALRNHAADLSGDTVIISRRDVEAMTIIRGDVFRCAASAGNNQELPKEPDKTDAGYLRKSTLCQSKGGHWLSNQCILPIE